MKHLIAIITLLTATYANAQHVDVRVGSNSQGISVSSTPFHLLGMTANIEGGLQRWNVNGVIGNQLYITPVFRLPVTQSIGIDLGVGVSVFDKTVYGNKDISTHFQFADHFGITYSAKSFAVGVRYVHASNAGIKKPNPGVDSLQATVSVGF
jgi:hypothetical protein